MARQVIQDIVSEMTDAFIGAGLADAGTYTAPAGSPIACRVFIGRAKAAFGSFGTVMGDKTTISLLLSEIPSPIRDAVVVADGETFNLVKQISEDDAVAVWEVQ